MASAGLGSEAWPEVGSVAWSGVVPIPAGSCLCGAPAGVLVHSEADIDHLMGAYGEALTVLKKALASGAPASCLRGAPMEPVFRKVAGFNTRPRVGKQTINEVARGRS